MSVKYLVGRYLEEGKTSAACAWEIVGVYDKEEDAAKSCKNVCYFVAPLPTNVELNAEDEFKPLAGIYYPKVVDNSSE